jgi:broad specificity phosphatase PhoE
VEGGAQDSRRTSWPPLLRPTVAAFNVLCRRHKKNPVTVMEMELNLSRCCRVVLAGLISLSLAMAAEPIRTVILVRHAERAGGSDPSVGISEAGRCRAAALATMLTDANVTGIYTSEVARTQQTAEPLAQKLGIRPEIVPAKEVDALVAKLRAEAGKGTLLVIGHSNTIPVIVGRLSGQSEPPIGDSEYDRMFVVTLVGSNRAKVVALRYPGCAP